MYWVDFQGYNAAQIYRYLSIRIATRYFVRFFWQEQSDDDTNDVENEEVQAVLSEEESPYSDNDDVWDSGTAISPNNLNTEAQEDNEQIFPGKDRSCWQALAKFSC